LVTALVPACIAPVVASIVPEAMIHSADETETGSLSSTCLKTWRGNLGDFDAVLTGPGMTTHEQTLVVVEQILRDSAVPTIVDADAINVCAGRADLIKRSSCPAVITPHPGEMARLLGCRVGDVQADRVRTAIDAVEETNAVVVLKGAGTLVAARGRPLTVNMTGNPGMATGGMGDVLSGLLTGLAGQGFDPFDAARIGVYLHGRAGDNVTWRTSQAGMIARDVTEELPNVFREVTGR